MTKAHTKELNIGDKLYKFLLTGVAEYEVFGARNYAHSTHYEIRCKNCEHGYTCEVLIVPGEKNTYSYVEMLNEVENDRQYYWHSDSPYFLTKEEALISYGLERLNNMSKEIEKTKSTLAQQQKQYVEMKAYVELNNKLLGSRQLGDIGE